MAGAENMRHSHATFDLNNALLEGNYPEWEFFIQTMDPEKQNDYRFDPLDCTKVGPSYRSCALPCSSLSILQLLPCV